VEEKEADIGLFPTVTPKFLPVFNRQELMERIGGDEELFKNILPFLPKSLNKSMGGLKSALEEKDSVNIRFYAHAIKGTSVTYSANKLSDIAAKMELAGKEGDIEIAGSLMDSLEAAAIELKSVLLEISPEIFQMMDEPEIFAEHSP
ncbi:MAG: Hpt domain-containing protein, partial [Desulfamplus sp.]|nr:Hpt domain-containing protein [Desulfamplus sp.]